MLRRLICLAALLGGLSSCGSEASEASSAPAVVTWSLDPDPVFVIGGAKGPPEYLFDLIRSVRFAGPRHFVVAQWGGNLVRVYDVAGRYRSTLGRSGRGPGEFAHLTGTWISQPDTVHVFDARLRRITSFLLDGRPLATRTVGHAGEFAGAFSDGSILILWIRDFLSRGPSASGGSGGLERDTMVYELITAEGERRGVFAEEPGRVRFGSARATLDAGPVPAPLWIHFFSPRPLTLVQDDTMYFTDGLRPIVLRTAAGQVARTIPLPSRPIPVGEARRALRGDLRERGTEADLARLDDMPRVGVIPAVAAMLRDDQGLFWLKRYDPVGDSWSRSRALRHLFWEAHGGDWWILEPDGEVMATISLPEGFIPMDVRGSLIIGITVDALEVERVVAYRVRRAASRPHSAERTLVNPAAAPPVPHRSPR